MSSKQSLSQPFWLELKNKNDVLAGRLQLQVHYLKDIQHRPLRIIAVTWNIGDAMPNDTLGNCFADIAECGFPFPVPCLLGGTSYCYVHNSGLAQPWAMY